MPARWRRRCALARRGDAARPFRRADVRGAQAADREGRHPAHPAPGALRRARRGDLPRQHRQVQPRRPASRSGRLRRLGRHPPADRRVAANTGAGPDIVLGWAEDPHIYADKVIELSDVAEYLGKKYGGWMLPRREVRQEGQDQQLDRHSDRRLRPARSSIASRRSRKPGFDKIPNDHAELPQALPGAEEDQQAGRLRARQRGRRRQRLRQLAGLVAWRLPGRRGRQGRDQQQGDDRGAEIS